MEVSGELHAPVTLPPGKQHLIPITSLGGPHSRTGFCGEYKNLLSTPEVETQPFSQYPVTIRTELSRLQLRVL
jgi:hypothetical protein